MHHQNYIVRWNRAGGLWDGGGGGGGSRGWGGTGLDGAYHMTGCILVEKYGEKFQKIKHGIRFKAIVTINTINTSNLCQRFAIKYHHRSCVAPFPSQLL